MRFLLTFYLCLGCSLIGLSQLLEAESGALSGTQISTQRAGYSGTGFVTGFDADGDKVTMTADIATAGVYNLYIRYASPSGEKYNFVYVNGENIGSVQFPLSAVFVEKLVGKIYLKKDANTIAIVKEWGYFDLDNVRLEASEPSDINHIAADLVTPIPSENANNLYDFLSKTYGKVILSGQYGGDTELNKIQTVSGELPLVRGFDLIEYSPSRVEHGATSTETEEAIEWDGQQGIVTISWHWNAPKDLIDQPGKEWWRGFYTDATNFDVSKAMNDINSEEYTLLLRDIDVIAIQLKKLQEANVPVLWRPLHEAEGAWFWWGAKGPEPCKWLWKLLFDRLVNHHHLDNLIWVWTSTASTAALDWYPGDAYVDIIGADIYLPPGSYSSNFIMFDNMVALFEGKKIITLSENGPIPNAENLFQERAAWSWFCTWSGDFILDGVSNSASHINEVYDHEYVITLDELNNVDAIIASLEERRQEEDDDVVSATDEIMSLTYQNPIRDNHLILTLNGGNYISKVVIYNALGEVEFIRENIDRRSMQLDFSFEDKSSGIYLVKVSTPGFTKVLRIIKI